MAIKRQNRALFFIFAVIVIALVIVLRREKKVQEYFQGPEYQEAIEAIPEQSPSPRSISTNDISVARQTVQGSIDGATEAQKAFVQVFGDMIDCLGIKSSGYSVQNPITMETILSDLQSDLGIPKYNSDLWMNWHLRTSEGKEKRIRIEISAAADTPMRRELRYFNVDREGIPQPVDIDDSKAINPSDETINQMLKEGDVFYKERSGFYSFSNGERLEYVEKNGELSEIEMVRGESIFKCSDIKARENCRCIK